MSHRHLALLRAINTGRRRVTNDDLVAAFAALGFAGARAYQASGNVLFTTDRSAQDAAAHIARGLQEALGYEVRTFVRDAATVRRLAEATPFPPAQLAASKGKPQITFLDAPVPAEQAAAAEALSTDTDLVVVRGREWFWLPHQGISGTTLDLSAVERAVGVGTTRTLGTVQRITKRL